jgi:hypothetical protein
MSEHSALHQTHRMWLDAFLCFVMTGPTGPAFGRAEDKLHGPVTHEFSI